MRADGENERSSRAFTPNGWYPIEKLHSDIEGRTDVSWLESQNTAVIVLLTLAFSYVLAAFIFVLSKIVATHRVAADLKATTPVMLTPLAVIIGLLIAASTRDQLGSRESLNRVAGKRIDAANGWLWAMRRS
jgi:hypothetical protein